MCISQEVLFDNGLVNKPLNATNCRLYNYGYQTNMIFKEKMFFWILDYISSWTSLLERYFERFLLFIGSSAIFPSLSFAEVTALIILQVSAWVIVPDLQLSITLVKVEKKSKIGCTLTPFLAGFVNRIFPEFFFRS